MNASELLISQLVLDNAEQHLYTKSSLHEDAKT